MFVMHSPFLLPKEIWFKIWHNIGFYIKAPLQLIWRWQHGKKDISSRINWSPSNCIRMLTKWSLLHSAVVPWYLNWCELIGNSINLLPNFSKLLLLLYNLLEQCFFICGYGKRDMESVAISVHILMVLIRVKK